MAKYTTELRSIVETGLPIFDFDYPYHSEEGKLQLQEKFIKHFYFREIGFETAGMFKHYLQTKFIDVLPYYNELFRTSLIKYDPTINYEVVEKYTKDSTSKSDLTTNTDEKIAGNERQFADTDEEGKVRTEVDTTTDSKTTNTGTVKDSKTGEVVDVGLKDDVAKKLFADKQNKATSDTPQGKVDIDSTDYVSGLEKVNQEQKEDNTTKTNTKNTNTNKADATITNDLKGTQWDDTNVVSDVESKSSIATNSRKDNHSNTNVKQKNEGNLSGKEIYEREMVGNIGVQTTMDMLKKHIELQKILTTIEIQFFTECDDLFMQLW